VSMGTINSEFAVVGAFYLSDSIDFGLKWLLRKHRAQEWAVVIYGIPDSYFQQHRCGYFASANDDWKKYSYGNFNEDPKRLQKQQMEVENDIIVGPICKFRATPPAHKDHTTLEPHRDGNNNICMQHAIITQSAADELNNYRITTWDIVKLSMD
jgi:hypothetical protein